jgi:hypothetical protein
LQVVSPAPELTRPPTPDENAADSDQYGMEQISSIDHRSLP